ncbi:hypothetical protein A5776_00730 [Mycolicibacterium elephantis]|uniref:hypothetical protein n=1 Tax=Mycolicibacterium elephantis TaxID=81858 RepID=UPI0007EA8C7B|nr:hypothetical protein [Mycolicibacterium elephantis]OBE99819.1 hypothetical protein A5776_00730 [Mycolicibacterium elephantis]
MAKRSKKAKRATALEAAGELMSSRRVVMERVALVSAIGRMRQATVLSTADVWDDVWDDGHRSGAPRVANDEEVTAAVGRLMQSLIDYGTAVKLAHDHGADLDFIASAAALGEDVSIDEIRCVMFFSELN